MNARAAAAEKILRVLNAKQRAKWDYLYRRAEKSGDYGPYKKRLLLNPNYLNSSFTLNDSQRKQLYYITWKYVRRIEKIRKRANAKIGKLLMPDQYKRWEATVHRRIMNPRGY